MGVSRRVIAVLMLILIALPFTPQLRIAASQEPVVVDGVGFDWPYASCHALDPSSDLLDASSYYYDSRDLAAWYYLVGSQYVFMRLDFMDLAYGAEAASGGSVGDALNIYVLIGWSNAPGYQEWVPDYVKYQGYGIHLPDYNWVLAIAIYDSAHYTVYDYKWSPILSNTGIQVAFNSRWDLLEIGVPASILSNYGWTPTTRVWAKVATVLVVNGQATIADVMPNTISIGNGRAEWSGALFSDSSCGTAKVIMVHHGNQHLTDNRALNPPSSVNSYGYILYVHEYLSNKTGRRIPVSIHMSGTLIASFLWWDPGFISYVKGLTARGLVAILGGVWAEHITAYFYDNFNDPSANFTKWYVRQVFGYNPVTAWVPERTWDDERTGIAYTLSKYYSAVILDANTHHDEWSPSTNPYKPHKYDTSRTAGRTLYVLFIDWDTQQKLLSNTDGGLHMDLRRKYIWAATNSDQQMVFIYADDWEKAAGIAGWYTGNPYLYNNSLTWIAMHPWIQVVTTDDVVNWLNSGAWSPVTGYYCGYDTYQYLKTWVQNYPYDYRRAYDGWYWGTSSEKSFAWYGSGQTSPKYVLPDTVIPFGDVFGYTVFNGSANNTVIYRLLSPGGLFDKTPRNELWWLALATANAMLYETAWHDESDWDGDGLQDCPGWGLTVWNHLRLVNVLLNAAKWLDDVRAGRVTKSSFILDDLDWDGRSEAVIYNQYLFIFIDDKGGAAPYIFLYNKTRNTVFMGVGAPPVYWGTSRDMWFGDAHVGFFADDYFTGTGKNYYNASYTIYSAYYDTTYRRVVVTLRAPDLDADGKPDFYKYYVLYDSSNTLYVDYLGSGKNGTLYAAIGFSVDVFNNLIYGNSLSQRNSPSGTSIFGYRNTRTGAYVYVAPIQGITWTGSQDLVKYTLQYRAKVAVSISSTTWSYAKAYFGYS
ncbi:glycoside hydrolase [Desulfurococcus mucosus]|uniref:Glycoside hydrolase family 57 n=1 Tax=Desulfurococcus mucosus (strain ATCC 35584 / DSM 2162 / JCM 9187 / O7/1) TaxID=765177 RepID=E8RAD6_DESM0|nr:glycoside hydrolase [Desulfurococcus mucosus]ADV64346.1 glycoside hydrolase family 57 [Desulfurococcus mucosus DSM 2162]